MLVLDHLAVAAETLSEGVEYVEDLFGVETSDGGRHPLMGTHNRLLSLGPDIYLEVIAIDPEATDLVRARWFDLDNFAGSPRLTNWIARTDDLAVAKSQAPRGIGEELALSRGDLRWHMLVPENGVLPFGGGYPALICWEGEAHPASMLPDRQCRLVNLEVSHPEAIDIKSFLTPVMDLTQVSIEQADGISIAASFQTPSGIVRIG